VIKNDDGKTKMKKYLPLFFICLLYFTGCLSGKNIKTDPKETVKNSDTSQPVNNDDLIYTVLMGHKEIADMLEAAGSETTDLI
jgi:PBP1b-binding outer membrane lipoprotein LpoB